MGRLKNMWNDWRIWWGGEIPSRYKSDDCKNVVLRFNSETGTLTIPDKIKNIVFESDIVTINTATSNTLQIGVVRVPAEYYDSTKTNEKQLLLDNIHGSGLPPVDNEIPKSLKNTPTPTTTTSIGKLDGEVQKKKKKYYYTKKKPNSNSTK